MNIVYIQADLRYNRWLLQKILNKSVLEYTLDQVKKLPCQKIVAGVYQCAENRDLISALRVGGVEVWLSDDEDVNSRFVNFMVKENAEYIIRVGADRVFLDEARTRYILEDMQKQKKEFFYHDGLSSVLPDIVSVQCLKNNRDNILQEARYFHALEKDQSIQCYTIPFPGSLLYDFRIHTYVSYKVCEYMIKEKLDPFELSMDLARRLKQEGSYLNQTGILGSWILGGTSKNFFWDENKEINPWLAKSITDIIKGHLNRDMTVFEWGTGNSTLFWSKYVGKVVSVEYDYTWYEKLKNMIPDNVQLEFCDLEYDGDYCRKILAIDEKFDIILIDGRDRVRCAKSAVKRIAENGVIIWDNSDREEYQEGYYFLKECGYKQLEICSVSYGIVYGLCTSLFYKENNILGI